MDEQKKLIDGTGPIRPQSTLPTAIETPALVEQLKAEQVSPEAVAQPYAQAADYMKQLNANSLADIQRNHVDTIGTERGGQRSLLVGGNDHYMMSRYSTPMVEDLANSFKVAASTRAFNQSMTNELERMQKEYERAAKARRSRDNARAAAAAAAQQASTPGGVAATFGALEENVVEDPNTEKRVEGDQGKARVVSGKTGLTLEDRVKLSNKLYNEAVSKARTGKAASSYDMKILRDQADQVAGLRSLTMDRINQINNYRRNTALNSVKGWEESGGGKSGGKINYVK